MTIQVFLNKAIGRIKLIVMPFINGVASLFVKRPIYVNAWIEVNAGKVKHENWGDDVNLFLISLLTDRNPVVSPSVYRIFRKEKTNYTCIGSIVGLYDNRYTIIWGSGAISKETVVPVKPYKVCSVRGPLTRQLLLEQGIDCPENYGDPALLISRYLRPSFGKKYKLGIIPHYKDYDNPAVKDWGKYHADVIIIKMQGYNNWTDIPEQICQCERIISSSLHGLIMADSYRVPNAWVRFSDKITGGDFKYHDYFASVGRHIDSPYFIHNVEDIDRIIENNVFTLAKNDDIHYREIIETCPFIVKEKDYINVIPKLSEYNSFAEKETQYAVNEYINTEAELDNILIKLQSVEKTLIFRGVSEAKYKMYTSSQRHWKQKSDWVARMGKETYGDFVEELIRRTEIIPEVRQYMLGQNIQTNDMFLMALMQHFGAPSPMIDFSESLLTGLFFASDLNDSSWKDSGKKMLGDYISLYYISKNFDWVEASIQNVMQHAAYDIERLVSNAIGAGVNLDTEEAEENIRRLLYRQFRLDKGCCIRFIPLGGPGLGRVKIDIPVLNFHCEYVIINDRIVAQQGMFIMNTTEKDPLVEIMNEQSGQKMFGCVNIHKRLLPYLRGKYLEPANRIHDAVYEGSKEDVKTLLVAIDSLV